MQEVKTQMIWLGSLNSRNSELCPDMSGPITYEVCYINHCQVDKESEKSLNVTAVKIHEEIYAE